MGRTILLSEEEKLLIKKLYTIGFEKGDGSFKKLCEQLSRHPATICKEASKMGLSLPSRSQCLNIKERLRKARKGIPCVAHLKDFEKEKIKNLYLKGFKTGDGCLKNLCIEINRHVATVVKYAQSLGLSNIKRKVSDFQKKKIGNERINWHSKNNHPRGMLGKKHSPEYCEVMRQKQFNWWKLASASEKDMLVRKAFKTKLSKYGTLSPILPGRKVSWKQGWREVGDKKIYFRSRWEANYARYLEFLKQKGEIKDWLHEPQTFWFSKIKRGTLTYLPDFKVIKNDETHYWVEVKGYYDQRSLTKIKRFKKYFPNESLLLIDKVWYKENSKKLSMIIKDWELDIRKKPVNMTI